MPLAPWIAYRRLWLAVTSQPVSRATSAGVSSEHGAREAALDARDPRTKSANAKTLSATRGFMRHGSTPTLLCRLIEMRRVENWFSNAIRERGYVRGLPQFANRRLRSVPPVQLERKSSNDGTREGGRYCFGLRSASRSRTDETATSVGPLAVILQRGFRIGVCRSGDEQAEGHDFEVPLPTGCGAKGVVMVHQLKSFAWRTRRAKKAGTVPQKSLKRNREIEELAPPFERRSAAETEYYRVFCALVADYERHVGADRWHRPHPTDALRELMALKGISQAQVAEALGDRTAASSIPSGRRQVSKTQAKKHGDLFNVDGRAIYQT